MFPNLRQIKFSQTALFIAVPLALSTVSFAQTPPALTPDRFAQFGQLLERFENVFQLHGRDLLVVLEIFQANVFGAK